MLPLSELYLCIDISGPFRLSSVAALPPAPASSPLCRLFPYFPVAPRPAPLATRLACYGNTRVPLFSSSILCYGPCRSHIPRPCGPIWRDSFRLDVSRSLLWPPLRWPQSSTGPGVLGPRSLGLLDGALSAILLASRCLVSMKLRVFDNRHITLFPEVMPRDRHHLPQSPHHPKPVKGPERFLTKNPFAPQGPSSKLLFVISLVVRFLLHLDAHIFVFFSPVDFSPLY